jgi:hypothetical protein
MQRVDFGRKQGGQGRTLGVFLDFLGSLTSSAG